MKPRINSLIVVMLAFALSGLIGCGGFRVGQGPQEVHIKHDPQRIDVFIHRDKKRLRNPPPPSNPQRIP